VLSAAFSPDGVHVVTTHSDGFARLWDLRATPPRPVLLNPGGAPTPVHTAVFSPAGERLVTAHGDGTFRLWRTADAWPMATIPGHSGAVTHVAFSGSGDRESVTTLSAHGVARIWHIAPAPVEHAACDFLRNAHSSTEACRGAR
jgi:WD40 repeat protein